MYTMLSDVGELMCWDREGMAPGLRNHVIAFSTVALTDQVTRLAASKVPGTLALTPQFERGIRGADAGLQQRAIEAIVNHPNVGAALIVTHDRVAAEELLERFSSLSKPVAVIALMAENGLDAALQSMTRQLGLLLAQTAGAMRRPMQAAELTVALECGGSDASSSVCANPAIGRFVDRLVAAGGTAIVSETAEFLGGEEVVRHQSTTAAVADEILHCMARVEALMLESGEDYRGVNPTQENIEAGLTTLTEKTMGALCKIGNSSFSGCLAFGEAPTGAGLFFMDTPFFSPTSLSGMALGGAQISLFAIGVFNPSGMPLMPVLKVCGNPATVDMWKDGIDLDVTGLIDGRYTLEQAADQLSETLCRVGNGELTATERRNEGQLIVPRTIAAL
ncbi:UxaA family hydrolase [Granulosicoccus sp. 3-233]|uniref:UxaA family hydrolase n=1 Tax=Granulosicoccus sp. 3-233 TaxID=3417969 RepID=UPI003D33AE8A